MMQQGSLATTIRNQSYRQAMKRTFGTIGNLQTVIGLNLSKTVCYWFALFCTLLLLTLPPCAKGQASTKIDARQVEAAFLSNFARYISWPGNTFDDDHSPWQICILGNDPFGDILEKTLNGRIEQGRHFAVSRITDVAQASKCQILYIAYKLSVSRRAAIKKLQNLPVLTVSNAPEFLLEGGMIQFDVGDYVKFSVNLDQARAASLSIQTRVLEVSNDIMVDGKIRKIR
jgi:hypothetical protein